MLAEVLAVPRRSASRPRPGSCTTSGVCLAAGRAWRGGVARGVPLGLPMPTGITSGKRKGLERVSDSRGVIAALAIDQRTALCSLIANAKGVVPEAIPGEMLVEFKEAVSRILTQYSSAILLDPEYGLPAARVRAANAGLLLAYEQSGYDNAIPGRLPRLLEHWSAKRLVDAGADCVKILLYYSPSSSAEIND